MQNETTVRGWVILKEWIVQALLNDPTPNRVNQIGLLLLQLLQFDALAENIDQPNMDNAKRLVELFDRYNNKWMVIADDDRVIPLGLMDHVGFMDIVKKESPPLFELIGVIKETQAFLEETPQISNLENTANEEPQAGQTNLLAKTTLSGPDRWHALAGTPQAGTIAFQGDVHPDKMEALGLAVALSKSMTPPNVHNFKLNNNDKAVHIQYPWCPECEDIPTLREGHDGTLMATCMCHGGWAEKGIVVIKAMLNAKIDGHIFESECPWLLRDKPNHIWHDKDSATFPFIEYPDGPYKALGINRVWRLGENGPEERKSEE